ncbi:MAG: hypothetical protein PVI86_17060 [Phycisphaerae bacterium]|jgi:hypothetical protein
MNGFLISMIVLTGPAAADMPPPLVSTVRAPGVGVPPPRLRGAQARLMARRAAEVRAVRNLAVKLGDRRRTTLRGFRYVSTTYRRDGSVRVVVESTRPPRSTIRVIREVRTPRCACHHCRRIR